MSRGIGIDFGTTNSSIAAPRDRLTVETIRFRTETDTTETYRWVIDVKAKTSGVCQTRIWFYGILVFMKANIELDDDLYRQLKATAALKGMKVRELVEEGVRMVLHSSSTRSRKAPAKTS